MINGIGSSGYTNNMSMGQSTRRPPGGKFEKMDADASGGLSQTELETVADETGNIFDATDAMSSYDEDQDGELSGQEMLQLLEDNSIRPEEDSAQGGPPQGGPPQGGPPQGGPPQGGPPQGGPQGGGDDPLSLFTDSDVDGSGGVSESELETLVETVLESTGAELNTQDALSKYDVDGDGELSGEELRTMLDENNIKPQATEETSDEQGNEQQHPPHKEQQTNNAFGTTMSSYLEQMGISANDSLLSQLIA